MSGIMKKVPSEAVYRPGVNLIIKATPNQTCVYYISMVHGIAGTGLRQRNLTLSVLVFIDTHSFFIMGTNVHFVI